MAGVRPEHPIKSVVLQQGRKLTWLALQLGISSNYLHRQLLPPTHPSHRTPQPDLYPRVARLLGVPESALHPDWEVLAAA